MAHQTELEKPRAPQRSLATSLAIYFLAFSVLLLIFSGSLGAYFSYGIVREAIITEQRLVAEEAGTQVSEFIEHKFTHLGSMLHLVNFSSLSKETQHDLLQNMTAEDVSLREIVFFDSNNTFKVGATNFSHVSPDALTDYITPDVFEFSQQEDRFVSPIYVEADTSEPFLIISFPVKNSLGERQGTFAAKISLKFLWDTIGNIQIGEQGEAYVVDEKGNLIAHKDIARVLKGENLSNLFEVREFLSDNTEFDEVRGEISKGIDGVLVLSTYIGIGTPHWAVVIEQPVTEAYKKLFDIALFSFLTLGLGIILAIGLAVYFSRVITQPILTLRNAVINFGKKGGGETEIFLKNANNELGELATAFNTMAAEVAETHRELENRVHERTAQLENQIAETERAKLAIANLLEDVEADKRKVEDVVVARTRELNDEKARLLASINSLSLGFIVADKNDNVLIKNPAMTQILGIGEDITSLQQVANYFSEFNLMNSCRKCMELGHAIETKDVLFGKKYLRLFCAPISGQEGDGYIGYVFLVEDVTENKVLERSREEFFAVASHELRTPLTAIRGNAEMILDMYGDKVTDKDMREMLLDINTSSVRLIDIVNDFLEVSRLEQGRIKIVKAPFDISEVIIGVVRDMQSLALKKGITLEYRVPKKSCTVHGDKSRVEQILVNLVGNAIKFTEKGGVVINLERISNFLKIQVIDTGVGVSEQNQSLLFRKFQQAGEKVLARDITQGTGLGLYISQLLISSMGGTIGLEKSVLGKGSTFTFTLPIVE